MRHHLVSVLAVSIALVGCADQPAAEPPVETEAVEQTAPAVPDGPMTDQDLITMAMSAAPADIANDATVVEPGDGGEMRELRAGTNGWVCMAHPFIMCLDGPWQNFIGALMSQSDPEITSVGVAYMLQGDEGASNIDPSATEETPDNEWVVTPAHLMILTPNAADLDALPTDPNTGGPWVMWKGTPFAHIMVPTVDMP